MAGEITAVDLQNAAVDAATMALVVNGDSTQTAIALRLGGTALSLRAAAATIAKGDPGASAAFRGAWDGTVIYALSDAVSRSGSSYVSLMAANLNRDPLTNVGPPPVSGGTVTVPPNWSGTTTYASAFQVEYAGIAYQSLMDNNLNRRPDLYVGTPVAATPPSAGSVNLYNPASAQNDTYYNNDGSGPNATAGYSNNIVPVTPGQTYTSSNDIMGQGCILLNADNSFAGVVAAGLSGGTPFTLPSGSYTQMRVQLGGGPGGSPDGSQQRINDEMFVLGSSLPGSYVAYGGSSSGTPATGGWEVITLSSNGDGSQLGGWAVLAAKGADGAPGTNGTNGTNGVGGSGGSAPRTSGLTYAVFGDSISSVDFQQQWQASFESLTGMVRGLMDCRSGRHIGEALEYYGCVTSGGTGAISPQVLTTNNKSTNAHGATYNNGTNGNTLAQDLGAAVVCIIAVGTNDGPDAGGSSVGSITDAPSAATLSGQLNFVIQQLTAAKPSMKLFFAMPHISYYVTAYQHAAMQAMYEAASLYYGIPIIYWQSALGANVYTDPSIITPNTSPQLILQSDGVHPLPLGFKRIGGASAGKVLEYFTALS